MSGWLVAFVGVIYAIIGIDQGIKGNWPMVVMWFGYALANAGLYFNVK